MKKRMDHSSGQRGKKKNHLMKSSWNLGKTVTIRIPLAIKEQLLAIARHIDSNGKIVLSDREAIANNSKDSKGILSQDISTDNKSDIPFSDNLEQSEDILSQDTLDKAISILRHGITSKREGGIYNSSNASTLRKEVIKAIDLLSGS